MSAETYSNILKSAGVIMLCTVVFKILGFIRDLLLTYYFGTSGISDAFLISLTIPGTLFEFVGTGLTACFIPVFYQILQESEKTKVYDFTNKITTIILSFSTVLIILVWSNTNFFINIFATGFENETFTLACNFTKTSILSLYFSALVYVFTSYLQANKIFYPSAITAVVQNFLVLVAIYVGAKINLLLMSVVFGLSIGVRLLYLYPCVKKTGFKFRLNFNWKDNHIYKFCLLLLPVAFGSAINDLNVIVDRNLASQIAVGAISALSYGNSLIQFANGGIIQPIATVYFPYITEHISNGKKEKAYEMLSKTLNISLLIFIPISIVFIVYSRTIIHVIFERGAFQEHSLTLTSIAFYYYSLGLCFIAIREFLARFFYAFGNTKTPMINAIIGVFLNIVFNLILSKYLGIGGLALATSISAAITALLLIVSAKRKLGICFSQIFGSQDFYKILLAGIVFYVLNKLYIIIGNESIYLDICIIFISLLFYILIGWILKIGSMSSAYEYLKMKFKHI